MPSNKLNLSETSTLTEFALTCLKCVSSDEIGDYTELDGDRFEPSPYYTFELFKLQSDALWLTKMTVECANIFANTEYRLRLAEYNAHGRSLQKLRDVYKLMLADVMDWTAPSESHEVLRKFMFRKILSAIHTDCDIDMVTEPIRLQGEVWRSRRLKQVNNDIAKVYEEQAKHLAEIDLKNQWVSEMVTSIEEQGLT